ncbi:MAG: hypothetical protein LUE25_05175 [Clostridiales bacterium]|nr:hypothetical protein [Clostridiales bacterium]
MDFTGSEEKSPIMTSYIIPSAVGALAGILISAALILMSGALISSAADPDSFIGVIASAVLIVAGLFSGIVGAKFGGGGFATGIASGAALVLIFFVTSLFFDNGGEGFSLFSLVMRFLTLGAAALGAYLSSGRKSKGKIRGVPRVPKIKRR